MRDGRKTKDYHGVHAKKLDGEMGGLGDGETKDQGPSRRLRRLHRLGESVEAPGKSPLPQPCVAVRKKNCIRTGRLFTPPDDGVKQSKTHHGATESTGDFLFGVSNPEEHTPSV